MSEKRQKTHSILLRTEGKTVTLELFPATEWPEENGGEGLFRVRVRVSAPAAASMSGGVNSPDAALSLKGRIHAPSATPTEFWHCPTGKYSFLTRSAVGELVAALLRGGEAPVDEPAPYLPCKADVSVYLEGSLKSEIGSVRTEPYQRRDGRWYCQVWVFGRGVMEFCCNDVTLRRVRR